MNKKDALFVSAFVVAGTLTIELFLACRAIFDTPDSGDAATWVQAIGTLIALGVAIYAPIWHAKKMKSERQRQIVGTSIGLIKKAREEFANVELKFATPSLANTYIHSREPIGRIETLIRAFEKLPIEDLPTPDGVICIVEISSALLLAKIAMNNMLDHNIYPRTLDGIIALGPAIRETSLQAMTRCNDFPKYCGVANG